MKGSNQMEEHMTGALILVDIGSIIRNRNEGIMAIISQEEASFSQTAETS